MRLIDANALKKQYIETDKWGKVILILDVVNAPTIDAEPVVHGYWTVDEKHTEEIYTNPVYCSVCGKDVVMDYGEYAPYCPNCGAKMDKGGDTE